MKKIITLICAICLIFMMALPAFAASVTKTDIINEVKKGVSVDGKTIYAPDEYVKSLSDFLNANELTTDELTIAMNEYTEAKEIVAASGATSLKELPAELKTQLLDKATVAAKKVGATLTFDGKSFVVVDKNGKTFSVASVSSVDTAPIKPTGADMNAFSMIIVTTSLVAVLGASIIMIRKFRLSEVR